jgi:hypothetical protein
MCCLRVCMSHGVLALVQALVTHAAGSMSGVTCQALAATDKPTEGRCSATATAAIADAVAACQETRQPSENRRRCVCVGGCVCVCGGGGETAKDGRADPERATNRATVTPARRPEPAPMTA